MNGSLLVFILHIQAHTTPRMHAPCARTATPAGMGRKQEGRRPCVFTPRSGSKVAAGIWSEKNFVYLCTTKTARCSVRLTVRTTDSQSVNKGSIPLQSTFNIDFHSITETTPATTPNKCDCGCFSLAFIQSSRLTLFYRFFLQCQTCKA